MAVIHQRGTTMSALEKVFQTMAHRINQKSVAMPDTVTNEETTFNEDNLSNMFGNDRTAAKANNTLSFCDHSLVYLTDETFVEDCATCLLSQLKMSSSFDIAREQDVRDRYQKLIDLANNHPHPLKYFTMYNSGNHSKHFLSKDTRHESYNWLIKLCASHIYCNPLKLDAMVHRLQLATVLSSVSISPDEQKIRVQFLGKYLKSRYAFPNCDDD